MTQQTATTRLQAQNHSSNSLTRIELHDGIYVVVVDQLGLVCAGQHMEEIQEDLLQQTRDYIDHWHESLHQSEPHKHNKQLIEQLEQADRGGTLPQTLFE